MKTVNKHKEILLEWFYYDKEDGTVRRARDGYYGRYKKDDVVVPYKLCSRGYGGVHIPTTRTTIPYHHLLLILQGVEIQDCKVIDHINGNKDDNSISNMRVTTQQLNCKNKRMHCNNTTGVTGIHKDKRFGVYVVRKQIEGRRVYLGSRPTLEEAKKLLEAYDNIIKADGYTDRHGK